MGFFQGLSEVFKNRRQLVKNKYGTMDLFAPVFSKMINPELNDTYMSCLQTHAKHTSKIKPKVYLKDDLAKNKKWLTDMLCLRPNPIMSASSFWEKARYNYDNDRNAFIYIDWDVFNTKKPIYALWVIDPTTMELLYDEKSKRYFMKFMLRNEEITTSLDNVIHIPNGVKNNEVFGEQSSAINQVLNVINTNFQGIENAIKQSSFIRFITTATTVVSPDKAKKRADRFAEDYLNVANSKGGLIYVGGGEQIIQVKNDSKYVNGEDIKILEDKILNYQNMDRSMLSSDFNEDTWQAYYETNLETFNTKLMDELNYKLFTEKERSLGNRVVISSADMQVINVQTKIKLIAETRETGLYTVNEARKLLNMPPLPEGGDIRLVSLNYINAEKADDYQMTKGVNKNDGS